MDMQTLSFVTEDKATVFYYTYGNPAGRPIFFIHGFPGTGKQGLLLLKGSTYEKDFFLVAMDRPGYGPAEYQPKFSLKMFSDYADQLMSLLGIPKFTVLSVSGGGPYAAAVSYHLGHRVGKTISINGIAPMKLEKFPFLNQAQKKMYILNKLLPKAAMQFLAEQVYNHKAPKIDKILSSDFSKISAHDRAVMDDPEMGPFLLETFKYSVHKGPYGLLSDMRIFLEYWGFEIKDIKVPYYLYHGDADDVVHPIWSQFMKDELTDVRFKLFKGEGHYSLPYNYRDHFLRDIMEDLV